jgi:hypothetical protein
MSGSLEAICSSLEKMAVFGRFHASVLLHFIRHPGAHRHAASGGICNISSSVTWHTAGTGSSGRNRNRKPAFFRGVPNVRDIPMAKKPDVPPPVVPPHGEVIPSGQGQIAAIASAHAPFLYFDAAPTFGAFNGILRITLDAAGIMPNPNGPSLDRVVVAHLRMTPQAALSLKAAIEGALLLVAPTQQKSH